MLCDAPDSALCASCGLPTVKSSDKLLKKEGATEENVVIADVTDPASLSKAMEGVEQVVLCTSAVPKVSDQRGLVATAPSRPRAHCSLWV